MDNKIRYSEILKAAWNGLKTQFWLLVGLIIGYTIVYSLLLIFAIPSKGETMTISGIITCVLCVLLGCLFRMGYLKNCLQTLDNEEPQFSAYGQESRKILSYLVASALYVIFVCIGTAFLIIPGIYLSLRLQFFWASMVDENTGIIESLKRSWKITKGHTLSLFFLMLITIGINIAGLLILFIGLFVTIPLTALIYGSAFRKLTAPAIE